jgi:hypothetical protein
MRLLLLTLVFFLLFVDMGCQTEIDILLQDGSDNVNVVSRKSEVKTFELVSLTVKESLSSSYKGTFGGRPVDLLRTSDSTLAFIVPDIDEGRNMLSFELANISFNVKKTVLANPDSIANSIVDRFNIRIQKLEEDQVLSREEIDSLQIFQRGVESLLTTIDKKQLEQTLLIYEANKGLFSSFTNQYSQLIDGPTTMLRQSECPKVDFKSFYSCTAGNLADAARALVSASNEFFEMVAYAGIVAGVALSLSALGPAALGIAAVGISLPAARAVFLFMTDVLPQLFNFTFALKQFMTANWIFAQGLFIAIPRVFGNSIKVSLQLKPRFRSIESSDAGISPQTSYFVTAIAGLNSFWNKMSGLLGKKPSYVSTTVGTTLNNSEVNIAAISNPNVKIVSQTSEQVTFKSESGREESFTYNISVKKQGFEMHEVITAKVTAEVDSSDIYAASAIGHYDVRGFKGNGPNSRLTCDLQENNKAVYTIYNDPSWEDGTTFPENWRVNKIDGHYYITTSFTNPGHQIKEAQRLTYPVMSFVYVDTYIK